MAFNCIRKATDEDKERLAAAARRFLKNHPKVGNEFCPDWDKGQDGATMALGVANCTYFLDEQTIDGNKRLSRLWQQAARRALRHSRADQIAYDNVGYSVD